MTLHLALDQCCSFLFLFGNPGRASINSVFGWTFVGIHPFRAERTQTQPALLHGQSDVNGLAVRLHLTALSSNQMEERDLLPFVIGLEVGGGVNGHKSVFICHSIEKN